MIHFFIQQTFNEAYNVHWIRHCEYTDEQGTVLAPREFGVWETTAVDTDNDNTTC